MPLRQIAAFIVLSVVALVSCSTESSERESVLVMAAASLTDAFAEIATEFEVEHPGFDVELNLAGSASLREQILQGAPADVFASANETTMQAVVDAGQTNGDPISFAANSLVIAVPAGNPGDLTGAADLADPDLLIGLCAAGVPCGDFARQALGQLGIEPSIDTNEPDVRALLTKIAADELDAGIVYATDVQANEAVESLTISSRAEVDITYPIVELVEAPNPEGAAAFLDFATSEAGQSILERHGFGTP